MRSERCFRGGVVWRRFGRSESLSRPLCSNELRTNLIHWMNLLEPLEIQSSPRQVAPQRHLTFQLGAEAGLSHGSEKNESMRAVTDLPIACSCQSTEPVLIDPLIDPRKCVHLGSAIGDIGTTCSVDPSSSALALTFFIDRPTADPDGPCVGSTIPARRPCT